jgi:hypothetical protein
MRGLLLISVCIFLVVASAAAHAQDEGQQWNRHEGYYGELNAGTGLAYLGVISTSVTDADTTQSGVNGFAWNAAVGYNFNPNSAIEGGFLQWYADFEKEDDDDVVITHTDGHGDDEVSTHMDVGYIAWRGTVPIRQRFAFFGKVGAMLVSIPDTDESSWAVLPFTGLGVSYAITPRIDFCVQYQGAVYIIVGAGAFTGGITYHF